MLYYQSVHVCMFGGVKMGVEGFEGKEGSPQCSSTQHLNLTCSIQTLMTPTKRTEPYYPNSRILCFNHTSVQGCDWYTWVPVVHLTLTWLLTSLKSPHLSDPQLLQSSARGLKQAAGVFPFRECGSGTVSGK